MINRASSNVRLGRPLLLFIWITLLVSSLECTIFRAKRPEHIRFVDILRVHHEHFMKDPQHQNYFLYEIQIYRVAPDRPSLVDNSRIPAQPDNNLQGELFYFDPLQRMCTRIPVNSYHNILHTPAPSHEAACPREDHHSMIILHNGLRNLGNPFVMTREIEEFVSMKTPISDEKDIWDIDVTDIFQCIAQESNRRIPNLAAYWHDEVIRSLYHTVTIRRLPRALASFTLRAGDPNPLTYHIRTGPLSSIYATWGQQSILEMIFHIDDMTLSNSYGQPLWLRRNLGPVPGFYGEICQKHD